MATKEQKQELVEILKFTPIRVRMLIQGYGGESYAGTVERKVYDYFKEKKIDITEYSSGWDDQFDVPAELQPFSPGAPFECDNLFHASGAELSELNEIRIENADTGEVVWEHNLSWSDLEESGVVVEEYDSVDLDDLDEGKVVFWGGQGEKGCFFDAEFELRAPFDPKNLVIKFDTCDGWSIINYVEYASEELDGSGGYSTTGKWADYKWHLGGDEEVYEPVSQDDLENQNDEDGSSDDYLEEAADAINETFADELNSINKDPLEIMYGYSDWYPVDVKPARKGMYECEFESTTWPWPIERMCEWTGRTWKENDEKAIGIKRWRGLASEPHPGD